MAICDRCKNEINFRYIDGIVRPLCPCGGWRYGDFRPSSHQRKPPTHEMIFKTHARCPSGCSAEVIFYQSPYGGKVYFDPPPGPPWPKHQLSCSNYSAPQTTSRIPLRHPSPDSKYQRQDKDWKPFELSKDRGVEETSGGITRIPGKIEGKGEELVLYILGTNRTLGLHPVYIKAMDERAGKYRISSFNPDAKTSEFHIEFDAYLPSSRESRKGSRGKDSAKRMNTSLIGATPVTGKGVSIKASNEHTKNAQTKIAARTSLNMYQRDALKALRDAGLLEDHAIEVVSACAKREYLIEVTKVARWLEAARDIIVNLRELGAITSDETNAWFDSLEKGPMMIESKAHAQMLAIRHVLEIKGYHVGFILDSGVKAALQHIDAALKKQEEFEMKVFAERSGAV